MRLNDAFYPGRPWLDTQGKRIQAHGGSVMYDHGAYYWYGENKERTTGLDDVWHWGVRCYRSSDLYNWDDLGLIVPPEPNDPASPLHPSACMDRPHILYNERSGKYVCWLKIMGADGVQTRSVLVADALTGPYEKVRTWEAPLGMSAGDFDLFEDADGEACMAFELVHSELVVADLAPDFTWVAGPYSTHFRRPGPPTVREGVCCFERAGKKYLLTSGTTGYFPNPSEVAVAASGSWHGPYEVLGDPSPEDASRTSWHSQASCVFKVQGKRDLYVAMADRWLPELTCLDYDDYAGCFDAIFGPEPSEPDWSRCEAKARAAGARFTVDCKDNTSIADYVWLPLVFGDDGSVRIPWRDRWSLDEFEDE